MTVAQQPIIRTFEELTAKMVRDLHAHAYENGPDLEEAHLSYEYLVPLEARGKWKAELKKRWIGARELKAAVERKLAEAKPARAYRRCDDRLRATSGASFFRPEPQPKAAEPEKDTPDKAAKEAPTTEPPTEEVNKLILALPARLRENVFKALGLKRLTEAKTDIKALTFQHSKTPTGIPGSLENALIGIDKLEIDCKYDVFHDRIYFGGEPVFGGLDAVALRVRQMVLERFKFDAGQTFTFDALRIICLDRVFDPVLDYLDSLQWDGKHRLDRWLITYCGADDTPLNRAIGRKCLVAGVRRVRQPGCKFDYITCLESRRQGIGKSTMLRILADFSDSEIIGLKKQEQQESVLGVWIYEIGELEGMVKSDVRHIKLFASKTVDSARPAYGRTRVDRPRRCIFFATTNETTYLRDTTGNRRFWPVRLHGVIPQGDLMMIDLVRIKRDRDQLWAEAVAAEATGEPLVIPEALWPDVEVQQLARMEVDPWTHTLETCLGNYIQKGKTFNGKFAAAADEKGEPQWRVESDHLLTEVLGVPKDRQHNTHTKRLVEIMRSIGWHYNEKTMRIGRVTTRGYYARVLEDELDSWQRTRKGKGEDE